MKCFDRLKQIVKKILDTKIELAEDTYFEFLPPEGSVFIEKDRKAYFMVLKFTTWGGIVTTFYPNTTTSWKTATGYEPLSEEDRKRIIGMITKHYDKRGWKYKIDWEKK